MLVERPLDEPESTELARVFKALGEPVRLRLLSLIASHAGGEACVCDLSGVFEVSGPTISHHLKVLEVSGLVEGTKRGRFVWYSLRPGVLERTPVEGDAADAINLGCCKILVPLETTVSVKAPAKRHRRAAGE